MVIDNHVHVGWFTDGYHTPKEVWDSAMAAGIDGMAVSSTSTCAELYKVVIRELRELKRLGGERVRPILWLTPRMLKVRYALPYMLHSRIKWEGIKMHWEAHPEWAHNAKLLQKALNVAKELRVPILLHTGDDDVCHATRFKDIIQENENLTFVLAHGRPIEEAINVLECCKNSFVDTAFMPISDIKRLVDSKLTSRMLFGTDAPINRLFYKDISTTNYMKDMIHDLRLVLGEDADSVMSRCVYAVNKENGWYHDILK